MPETIWSDIALLIGFMITLYTIIIIAFYLFIFVTSAIQLRKEYRLKLDQSFIEHIYGDNVKPISILVPAYNEEAGIIQSVRSLLNIHYPLFEIIVINDGSKDSTLEKMIKTYDMTPVDKVVRTVIPTNQIKAIYQSEVLPNLYLIDKENGGKADALNAGLNFSNYPYFCSLDGDSILERDAFIKVMKPILDSNNDVIASGGSIRIANGCKIQNGNVLQVGLSENPLAIMQTIEYLRAFLMGRIGLSRHNLLLIVSGAFGVFSKSWVLEAGGYKRDTVGEDMELVIRLHRLIKEKNAKKQIVYIPDPVCWTEVPEEITYLRRQRRRWHQGLFESLWAHKKMLANPKYGNIGFISLPYFWIVEFFGPIVEFTGYLYMITSFFIGGIYLEISLLLFLLSFLYGSIFSMGAVLLEEWSLRKYPKVSDIINLFLYSLTETFWYRPLTVFWRLEGIWNVMRGKHQWGEMKRKGISE
ncbi:glycosyltransferase family 2 protein [Ureibacillus xyleni]|nr:glycosyltransferase [Ureibacillus xyleni]